MTKILECENKIPKALEKTMISMEKNGKVVYNGFPIVAFGERLKYILHDIQKNLQEDEEELEAHKKEIV